MFFIDFICFALLFLQDDIDMCSNNVTHEENLTSQTPIRETVQLRNVSANYNNTEFGSYDLSASHTTTEPSNYHITTGPDNHNTEPDNFSSTKSATNYRVTEPALEAETVQWRNVSANYNNPEFSSYDLSASHTTTEPSNYHTTGPDNHNTEPDNFNSTESEKNYRVTEPALEATDRVEILNKQFQECCVNNGIQRSHLHLCSYNATSAEMIETVLLTTPFPIDKLGAYQTCAAQGRNNTECCERVGALKGMFSKCRLFCDPADSSIVWPTNPSQAMPYMRCHLVHHKIFGCHLAS